MSGSLKNSSFPLKQPVTIFGQMRTRGILLGFHSKD